MRFLLQCGEACGAGVDQREVGLVASPERGQMVDRRIVLAAGGAQREQALLDALELPRIEVRRPQRLFEMAARLVERVQRGIERLDRRLDQRRRLHGAASSRRTAAASGGTGDCGPLTLSSVAQILGDLFGLHHGGAPLGERGLLAGLGREVAELLDGVAQPVGLAAQRSTSAR